MLKMFTYLFQLYFFHVPSTGTRVPLPNITTTKDPHINVVNPNQPLDNGSLSHQQAGSQLLPQKGTGPDHAGQQQHDAQQPKPNMKLGNPTLPPEMQQPSGREGGGAGGNADKETRNKAPTPSGNVLDAL